MNPESPHSSLRTRLDASPASRRVAIGAQVLILVFVCTTYGVALGWQLLTVSVGGALVLILALALLVPMLDARRHRETDRGWGVACLATLRVAQATRRGAGGRFYVGHRTVRWEPNKKSVDRFPLFDVPFAAVRQVEVVPKPLGGCAVYLDTDVIGAFKVLAVVSSRRMTSALRDAHPAGP